MPGPGRAPRARQGASNYNRSPPRRGRLAGDSDDSVPVDIRDGAAGRDAGGGGPAEAPGGPDRGADADAGAGDAAAQVPSGSGAGDAADSDSSVPPAGPGGGEGKETDDGGGDVAAPDCGDLRSRLRDAEARAAGLDAQLRRALADYRNLERRARGDVDSAVRERVARFAADMVSVRDDFERAAKAAAGGAEGAEAVSAGLGTVLRGMDSALSKHGVAPIEAIGEIFDPHRHEAVATVEDGMLDEGTITAEAARGYSLDERIIRPSRVVISKKPATKEAGA